MTLTITITYSPSQESSVGKLLEALAIVAEVDYHVEAKKIDTHEEKMA